MGLGKCGRAIDFLCRYANKTETAVKYMRQWPVRIQFILRGEDPFHVIIEDGQMQVQAGRLPDAEAEFRSASDVFFDVMTGHMDPSEGFTMKKYEIKGSVFDVIRFRHVGDLTEASNKAIFGMLRRMATLVS